MPLQATSGAASQDAFGGNGVAVVPNFIEDVFSTYLYTGNGTSETITNGIDLSTKGGLVWTKSRDSGSLAPRLNDTVRGITNRLFSNLTNAQSASATSITAVSSTGYTVGSENGFNESAKTFVSWTFRKQPKFFDVVTYTGTGSNRTIAHSLGSVPGSIIVKRTDTTANWAVYHRSLANTEYLVLNSTAAAATGATWWNSTTPTSSVFSIGTDASVNASGGTYVAYLFAHDAGGFGLTGTDNVISCGSYTGNGSATGPVVTLGYEPQWILFKKSSAGGDDWQLYDNMRGLVTGSGGDSGLFPNLAAAEDTNATIIKATATGFELESLAGAVNASGATYVYVACRRGPMKVPTSGTSVFGLNARTGTDADATVTGSAGVSDAVLVKNRGSAVASLFSSRLTGTGYLVTSSSAAEVSAGATILQANPWDVMDGVKVGTTSTITNASANTYINYLFRRAPSFFDEVCYTGGTGTPRVLNHNLTTPPELVITKRRNVAGEDWVVHYNNGSSIIGGYLNNTTAFANSATAPSTDITSLTSTTYTLNTSNGRVNGAYNYVAYLFATCAGVSKVGSYTGTGTTLQIDCGFTAGARFVLIKRTDSTGDWYVWDTARGIVSGNDPYLRLNSTAAEVTGTDYIDTYSAGFEISSTAPADINASAGTFIFLAIA